MRIFNLPLLENVKDKSSSYKIFFIVNGSNFLMNFEKYILLNLYFGRSFEVGFLSSYALCI